MTTYGFRLRSLLPKGRLFTDDFEPSDLKLHPSDPATTIRVIEAKSIKDAENIKSIKDAENITIKGTGFPSEVEASQSGQRLKKALRIVGASLKIGIDVGKDQAKEVAGKSFVDSARQIRQNLIDDIHGLCVYEENLPRLIHYGSSNWIVGISKDKFVQELTNTYIENPKLSEKQALAFELYNSSHFESSLSARFITLVTAVEALVARSKRPEDIVRHLDVLIDSTSNSALCASQKEIITDDLGNLKRESISKAFRSLAKKRLGIEAEASFQKAYKIRGYMLHTGIVPRKVNLGVCVPKLDELVSKLIIQDIKGKDGTSLNNSIP